MLFEVEFCASPRKRQKGELLRRVVVGTFANPGAVEQKAIKEASSIEPRADALRIYSDGTLKRTGLVRPMTGRRLAV